MLIEGGHKTFIGPRMQIEQSESSIYGQALERDLSDKSVMCICSALHPMKFLFSFPLKKSPLQGLENLCVYVCTHTHIYTHIHMYMSIE